MSRFDHSTQIQRLLDELREGDLREGELLAAAPTVRARLIERAFDRLCLLARIMFRREEELRSVLETDDLLQAAAMRLHRALPEVKPESVRAFFGLAALQIRRELVDLARRYLGGDRKHGRLVNYVGGMGSHSYHDLLEQAPAPTAEPGDLEAWSRFHEQVDLLPDELRELVGLLYYQGLSQPEAAELLELSVRTVKRRWREAKLALHRRMMGDWPGLPDDATGAPDVEAR